MRLQSRRLAFVLTVTFLLLLAAGLLYYRNLAVYTASLETRPLNIGLVHTVESLDPALLTEHEERLVASALYEGLVSYDEKAHEIKPVLARSWKFSRDGKTLTLFLKKGLSFHNGKKVDAQAVKAGWEKNFSTTKEWANVSLFLGISGSSDRLEGRTQEMAGIQAVDNETLKVTFDRPNSAFLYMLTSPIFWVYDAEDENTPAAGTGPFVCKEQKDKNNLLLVRNEKYHLGRAPVTALNFQVYKDEGEALGEYKSGKIDFLDAIPIAEMKGLRQDKQYKDLFIYRPVLYTYSLGLNMNAAPFSSSYELRRALNYAIDRNAIAEEVLGGAYRPIQSIIPRGLPAHNPEMRGYKYDVQKARELLVKAGYPEGEGLQPLVISYDQDEGHAAVLDAVARQLGAVGIEVQLQPMDWEYYKKQLGKNQLGIFRVGWQADYPDADSFVYSLFHSSKTGISNYFSYQNPQVDKILFNARAQLDEEKRIQALRQAEEIIVDDAPCIWLFQKMAAKLISPGVRSLEINCMELVDWYRVELHKPATDKEAGGEVKKV